MAGSFLTTAPDDVFIATTKRDLVKNIREYFVAPLEALDALSVHNDLLPLGKHDVAVNQFLSEDHKFEEYKKVRSIESTITINFCLFFSVGSSMIC